MVDLKEFKALISKELGIDLFSYKEDQLDRRLNNFIQRRCIKDMIAYAKILGSNDACRIEFLDYITINVTEFYRNPELYEELSQTLKRRGNKKFKIWSAACSNGCEPYSLAIMLNELGFTDYNITATDLDPTILKKAALGKYEKCDLKNLSEELISKYFKEVDGKFIVIDKIKKNIKFKIHDLIIDRYQDDFDLILCRNVVIYFNTEAKDVLYKKMSGALNKDGILFVGATENIYDYKKFDLEKLSSFIYVKK